MDEYAATVKKNDSLIQRAAQIAQDSGLLDGPKENKKTCCGQAQRENTGCCGRLN